MKQQNFKLVNILICTLAFVGFCFIKSYASTLETQENTTCYNDEINISEIQNQIHDFRELPQPYDVPLPIVLEIMSGFAGFDRENCTII